MQDLFKLRLAQRICVDFLRAKGTLPDAGEQNLLLGKYMALIERYTDAKWNEGKRKIGLLECIRMIDYYDHVVRNKGMDFEGEVKFVIDHFNKPVLSNKTTSPAVKTSIISTEA